MNELKFCNQLKDKKGLKTIYYNIIAVSVSSNLYFEMQSIDFKRINALKKLRQIQNFKLIKACPKHWKRVAILHEKSVQLGQIVYPQYTYYPGQCCARKYLIYYQVMLHL